ncbi:hypothetical protein TNCV_202351 [Trichonephila clavipes]|nr:hypothetical protein TNCV_202351 [Trichonephila clavipes]
MSNVRDDMSVGGKIGVPTVLCRHFTCDFDLIPKIKEPIRGRRLTTREDIANAVCRQMTRSTQGVANSEVDGIQCLPYRLQRVSQFIAQSRWLSDQCNVYCLALEPRQHSNWKSQWTKEFPPDDKRPKERRDLKRVETSRDRMPV